MTAFTWTTPKLARIDALLDRERKALKEGRLEKLEPMVAEREKLVEDLKGKIDGDDRESVRKLKEIRSKAQKNASLYSAALDGIKSANARVAAIRQATEHLSTYSQDGEVSDVMDGQRKIEKRA